MNVKLDTKEKFTVITLIEEKIPANMTADLEKTIQSVAGKANPHVVLNFSGVQSVDKQVAEMVIRQQQAFYGQNASFIVCGLEKEVERVFRELEDFDLMNFTPTESEAWDILQMEEIERELMRDEDGGMSN